MDVSSSFDIAGVRRRQSPGLSKEGMKRENQKLEMKSLHGQTADVAGEDSWKWPGNGFLKKQT